MGAGGVPNRGVDILYDSRLDPMGKPNSRLDRYNKDGKKVQSRWYDNNGRAIRNRDYSHSGKGPFPHDHDWTWDGENGHRGEDHLPPNYDVYPDKE